MKGMGASGLRGGDQRRRVVVLVKFHYLAVAKRPEISLRRVADLARLPIPPRGRPSHGDVVALRDEVVGLVMDHLPVGEQPLEVPLDVLLGLDRCGELRLRRPGGQGETPDVIHHEIEPGLDAPPLLSCHSRYAAFSFATLSEEDPMAVTSRSGHGQMGPEPRERARSYHTPPPWTRAPNLGSRLTARGVSSTRDPGGPAHEITPILDHRAV